MSASEKFDPGKRLLRIVQWRDLAPMSRRDGLIECLHPVPWLLGSWCLAGLGYWPAAAACSFMFFLTALRLNHEAIHAKLGFRPGGHRRPRRPHRRGDARTAHARPARDLTSNIKPEERN